MGGVPIHWLSSEELTFLEEPTVNQSNVVGSHYSYYIPPQLPLHQQNCVLDTDAWRSMTLTQPAHQCAINPHVSMRLDSGPVVELWQGAILSYFIVFCFYFF